MKAIRAIQSNEIFQKVDARQLGMTVMFYPKAEADAEIARLEELVKEERNLRKQWNDSFDAADKKNDQLEAEVERFKTAIKTFSDKWQYYDSKTIAGLDELRQALSGR